MQSLSQWAIRTSLFSGRGSASSAYRTLRMATTTTTTKPAATKREIREGSAVIELGSDVFYNNVQVVNRDLSVLALNVFLDQHQREIEARTKWKREGHKEWRRSVVTWDNWGDVTLPKANSTKTAPPATKKDDVEVIEGVEPVEESEKMIEEKADDVFRTSITGDGSVRILEALSASGLRSIRYAKEVAPEVKKHIIANDREEAAVESIRNYTEKNAPYPGGTTVMPSHADAIDLMHSRRKDTSEKFTIVDLDPYGAPSVFLDSAVQCIEDGGLLCVTATDTAVLCGSNAAKCRPKYGGVAIHRPYAHEMAIRMVLASIESHAIRHNKFIVPLLSLKLDFYIRVFVRVHGDHLAEVAKSATRHANVLQSKATATYRILPLMSEDGERVVPAKYESDLFKEDIQSGSIGGWIMGGPIWSAPMHNPAFLEACLTTLKKTPAHMKLKWGDRIEGVLAAARDELHDVPLYYENTTFAKILHCSSLPMVKFQAALMNAGFRASQSHHTPTGIKTDAPPEIVWDILRCWVMKHPISQKRLEGDSLASKLLSVPPRIEANFDSPRALREMIAIRKAPHVKGGNKKDSQSDSKKPAAPKWHQNPEKYWGPKARAHGAKRPDNTEGASSASGASKEQASKKQQLDPKGQ